MFFIVNDLNIIHESTGDNCEDFSFQCHIEITETNSKGGEAFVVDVVSPKRLEKYTKDEIQIGRGLIITDEFSKSEIIKRIQKLIDGFEAENWDQLCAMLERYFDMI